MDRIIDDKSAHAISHRSTDDLIYCTCGSQAYSDYKFETCNGTVRQYYCARNLQFIGHTTIDYTKETLLTDIEADQYRMIVLTRDILLVSS